MITATVAGTLGRDAELRDVGSGTVCSFSVASTRKVKGEQITDWIGCSLWGKRGEALVQYLTKGSKVCVSGELSTREHNGKTRLELNVSGVELLGGPRRETGQQGHGQSRQSRDDEYSEDIPF